MVDTKHLIRYGGEFVDEVIERAEGSWLTTTDGRRILDFTSGQMCATIGHSHPAVVAALSEAAQQVIHLFSGMLAPAVLELAAELAALLPDPLDKLLLVNTGSESNEAALRIAKLHTGGFEVLGLSGSWHGMTSGAASSTYSAGRRGYGPGLPGTMALPTPNCYRCPIAHCRDRCDLTCLEVGMSLADSQATGAYAAVVVEPVLSAGGIVPLPPGYLSRLAALCRERGLLLIVDEAQTAMGRTGELFASHAMGVVPDIMTLSKTLGGGLPLAATATNADIEQDCADKGLLYFTSHVSDPLPAAVGLAVLRIIVTDRLVERARVLGARLREGLRALADTHEAIGDVRGMGLLLGVDVVTDRDTRTPDEGLGGAVTRRCLELGLNVNIVKFRGMGSVLRLAPPLTTTDAEIDLGLELLDQAFTDAGALARRP
ncbi:MAG: aspartate aminotransferase family protein [Micromonosporaceae bacterium]